MAEMRQLCTFHVDDLLVGVEARRVQEVVRCHDLTPVPLAPRAVHGLMNLRGDIVTAIDLRTRLCLPPRRPGASAMSVVLSPEYGLVSLIVDAAGDVLELEEERLDPPPGTLQGTSRDLILGAYKLRDRLLVLLDVERTIDLGADAEGQLEAGRAL
jgi:purine-binding chemotaxis protein CheW